MNNKEDHTPTKKNELEDRHLERLFDFIHQPEIDNTRIKSLVRGKIQAERRKAFRHRIYTAGFSAAAIVAIIIGIGFIFNTGRNISLQSATAEDLKEAGYLEINVPAGERTEIELPDGSRLIANYNSHVIYPEKFDGKERRIFACGEVYIEVAKDKSHPFIVESEGFEIKVLGTIFNIDNINSTSAKIVLVEGSIDLTTTNDQKIRLKPNELVALENGDIAEVKKVDPDDYTSWIKGLISLQGETMQSLSNRLEEFYGIDIVCDPKLAGTKVYGKLDLRDSIEDVLASVGEIVPMKATRSGNSIILKRE